MRVFLRHLGRPTSLIWIFSHILMFICGFAMLSEQSKALIGSTLAEGIGGSLVATGAAGTVLFLYVFSNDNLRERVSELSRAGLDAVFPFRSVRIKEEYAKRLNAPRHIDIVGFGLSAFRQDYSGDFVKWSHSAKVRILLVNPDFPTPENSFALLRDREEGHSDGQTRSEVLQFEKVISELTGLNGKNFEVRRMLALPSINMFRIDEEIFWGPYLMNRESRNTPTLLVARGGFLFAALEEHFEAVWKMSHSAEI